MKLLLEPSMECETLSRAEAISAMKALGGSSKVIHAHRGVLVVETEVNPDELASRLALCHFVNEWLGSCESDEIESFAKDIEVQGPIRVRSKKTVESGRDLIGVTRRVGGIIGRTRGVDLTSPATDVRLILSDKVHFGRTIARIDRSSFEKRKNRYLPFVYPASLHPKFARALVNLTETRKGATLLDPFCGTGAIVVEASMIHMKAIGTDISQRMIDGASSNLRHLGLSARLEECEIGDIGESIGEADGIATDPPYGRSTSTKRESLRDLYRRMLVSFSEVLPRGGRAALVVPDLRLLVGSQGFEVLEKHSLWVHRSLTRNFCVLKKL